ncbi:alcohol dehydrogenase [Campylobacter hyointestinalis subsp. hyointestinalis]|uniref:nucleotidyltransferase family protein n=1 Tax=Campylobacter hyointestinalis TaxID=198 RepID=UPI000CE2B880|nr:nucleotidyltransferase family protein [Campylobacter hyointestinalis]PPB58001.1 alcohol dehydrogenase [Campylobacter hyointestinalis subsp. hyointestinalis]
MNKIDNIKLKMDSSVREALSIIDAGSMQIALATDDFGKLLGTITDGDIRRGLLGGLDLNSSIENVINKHPTIAKASDTKETIIKLAIDKKLKQIPILDDNNIVIGIQEIDELIKSKAKPNKVVLMVGGLGTRLRPLTDDTPKPMLDVGNKPILQTIVEKFAEHGYTNIIMCVNYKAHIIRDYFGDGSKFGVNIEYVLEKDRMGTAGALSLLKRPNEDFFVMNGDLLTNVNFEYLHEYHMINKSSATMCIREYSMQVPYGVVNLKDNKICSIKEKPIHKFFVSAGIYMLSPSVLDFIPHGKFYDMPSLFDVLLSKNLGIHPFPIREYWLDIGRIEEYKKANEEYDEVF